MSTYIIMLIVLVLSGGEIFFGVFSKGLSYIMSKTMKNFNINNKVAAVIKLIVVALFLMAVIYFLVQFVKLLATWFGISLDKSILDIFK